MARFENIPERLRSGATLLAHPSLTDGQFLSITGLMEDAALKIEALERDAARYGFLRERDLDAITEGGVFAGMTPDNVVLNGDDLDRHVDRMMHSKEPEA